MTERCGLDRRHLPHWFENDQKWCDGKPPYLNDTEGKKLHDDNI